MHVRRVLGLATLVVASAAAAALAGASSGPAATTLVSIDELNGLACSSGVDAGTIVVSTAAGGDVTFEMLLHLPRACPAHQRGHDREPDLGGERVRRDRQHGRRAGRPRGLEARVPLRGGHQRGNPRHGPAGSLTRSWSPVRLRRHEVLGAGEPDVQQRPRVRRGRRRPANALGTAGRLDRLRQRRDEHLRRRSSRRRSRTGREHRRLPDGHDSNYNAADFSSTSPPTPGRRTMRRTVS